MAATRTNQPIDNEYDHTDAGEGEVLSGVDAASSLAIASGEINQQIATAKRFPRPSSNLSTLRPNSRPWTKRLRKSASMLCRAMGKPSKAQAHDSRRSLRMRGGIAGLAPA